MNYHLRPVLWIFHLCSVSSAQNTGSMLSFSIAHAMKTIIMYIKKASSSYAFAAQNLKLRMAMILWYYYEM